MKKLEIAVSGDGEEEMARALLAGIDKVLRDYEGMEVSVRADDVTGSAIRSSGFWSRRPGRKEGRGLHGRQGNAAQHQDGLGDCKEPGAEAHG